jgi:GNAT superfamily N-acetyltransferase
MADQQRATRIEPVTGRVDDVAAVLAASLVDAPGTTVSPARKAARLRLLRRVLAAATGDAVRHGHAYLATGSVPDAPGEQVLGALLLMPPGSHPPGPARRARMAPAMLRAALAAPRQFVDLRRSAASRGAMLPASGDWWLLHTIGVHPRAHRRGVGRDLLSRGLADVDATGLPCHLHTASPAAAALFRTYGFVSEAAAGHGHRFMLMTRPGRS